MNQANKGGSSQGSSFFVGLISGNINGEKLGTYEEKYKNVSIYNMSDVGLELLPFITKVVNYI